MLPMTAEKLDRRNPIVLAALASFGVIAIPTPALSTATTTEARTLRLPFMPFLRCVRIVPPSRSHPVKYPAVLNLLSVRNRELLPFWSPLAVRQPQPARRFGRQRDPRPQVAGGRARDRCRRRRAAGRCCVGDGGQCGGGEFGHAADCGGWGVAGAPADRPRCR